VLKSDLSLVGSRLVLIELETRVCVSGLRAREVTDYFARCDDRSYQRWWPGTHLALHPVRGHADAAGGQVYFDEFIGARRIRLTGQVIEFTCGRRIVWQLRRMIRLPAWLSLELSDEVDGVRITHRLTVGLGGAGQILDTLLWPWFDPAFRSDLDQHVRREFPLLRDNIVLPQRPGGGLGI
jgi:hypothetical protein